MAEGEGFEPSVRLRVQRFSRPSRSTTPATLHLLRCVHNQICASGTRVSHIKNELELQSINPPYHSLEDFALSAYPMVEKTQRLLERQGWPFSTAQTRL